MYELKQETFNDYDSVLTRELAAVDLTNTITIYGLDELLRTCKLSYMYSWLTITHNTVHTYTKVKQNLKLEYSSH